LIESYLIVIEPIGWHIFKDTHTHTHTRTRTRTRTRRLIHFYISIYWFNRSL